MFLTMAGKVFVRLIQISMAIIAELFRCIERFAFRNGEISSIIHVLLRRPEEGDSYVHKCGGASDNRC